jgi:hypothetical protein
MTALEEWNDIKLNTDHPGVTYIVDAGDAMRDELLAELARHIETALDMNEALYGAESDCQTYQKLASDSELRAQRAKAELAALKKSLIDLGYPELTRWTARAEERSEYCEEDIANSDRPLG